MGYIDIKKLTLDELAGVVNLYPWFGGARKELCERMSRIGGDSWGEAQYADAAMYIGAREKLAAIVRSGIDNDWADADVERLLRAYISENEESASDRPDTEKRKVYAGAGDYFSQDEYDKVRKAGDNVFFRPAKEHHERPAGNAASGGEPEFYTETLAEIYMEQGYYEQAKHIYSKLILAYPEKSAYFADLIQKMNGLN